MATKHVNDDKDASFNRSRGRDSGPSDNSSGRERNTGHSKAEEHSRVSKGHRGNKK